MILWFEHIIQIDDNRWELKNLLWHMALSQVEDGRLQPMRPSNYPIFAKHGVIDDYSCLWIQAVRELYDRTQDEQFLQEMWPRVVRAMNCFLKRRTANGIVYAGEFIYFHNPLVYVTCEGTSINAFIYGALLDAAYLADKIGDGNRKKQFDTVAKSLFGAVNTYLWNNRVGSYYGAIINYEEQK